jgi:serine protease Do
VGIALMRVLTTSTASGESGRTSHRLLRLAAVGGFIVSFFSGAALARETPTSFADLAERLSPAVVNVSTTQAKGGQQNGPDRNRPRTPPGGSLEDLFRDFLERQGPPRKVTSLGSGFIIDATGYVVTNNHVIAEADEISVTLSDDSTFKATVVGKDQKTDLALLKLDLGSRKAPLPTVKFGDSDKSRVGDWVMAIGNPFGLGGSVSVGIISARARSLQGPYDDFLQTDAAINKGNSGGPMFNMDGEVIGINTAIYSPSGGSVGIGFAIPSNLASSVVDQLREFGRTKRGWLGVRIQTVDEDLAKTLALDKPRGALVADITPGGPAEKADIKPRDVILSFDGKEITEMRKLSRVVAEAKVGAEVDVVIWRDGKRRTVKAKVGELEEAEKLQSAAATSDNSAAPKGQTLDTFGLTLTEMSAELRDRYDIPAATKGVVVTKVQENSTAAEKGIRAGDVIVDINQHEVKTPNEVATRVKEARDAKRKSVLLLIDRQGDLRFVGLRIDS